MARRKVKLSWVAARSKFEKKKLALVKKVRDLTILCDVKACLILFSPNETESMVWPSVETGRELIEGYYALPEYERKKKETTQESYMEEEIARIQGRLRNIQKKNMEHTTIDQLMVQLSGGARSFEDLNWNEMYLLVSFSKDMIMNLRKRLDLMHLPLLPDPFEPRTTTNDVYMIQGGQRINIGSAIHENQTHYLMDQWIPSSEPSNPQIDQQIGMQMGSYNKESHHPYQGSSSSGNPNSEIVPPMVTFHGLFGSLSQEPPPTPSNVVIRQEPPPPKEAIPEGGSVSAMSFDLNKDWPGSLDF